MTLDVRRVFVWFGTAAILAALAAPSVAARDLSFEDRVRYQRAIEDVYWRHRIWPKDNPTAKPSLSEVMSDEAIRTRVEDYLKKSTALEAVWQHRTTREQLQAELDRIVRDTRSVATLKDLFRTLGDDPLVIAETLARQTLVDRLARDWYASDSRFHGETKRQAEAARAGCRTVAQMRAMGGEYREVTFVRRRDGTTLPAGSKLQLGAFEWEAHRASLERGLPGVGSRAGRIGELEETRDGFSVTAVLLEGADETQLATVTFAKTPFETWWSQRRAELSATVDTTSGPYEIASPSGVPCVGDTWRLTLVGTPRAREYHTAVWTGSEMIVWGGYDPSFGSLASGGRYNPATDSWLAISAANAPTARFDHTSVWTGSEMITWGGRPTIGAEPPVNTGGRYNPATDTWSQTSISAGVPTARSSHTAVWSGNVMIAWGGLGVGATGGRYDPSTDTWAATSSVNAPSERNLHTAVWIGSEMIVWGGTNGSTVQNTGARYTPSSNSWVATSTVGAPSARRLHTAVWTGSQMIIWGGLAPADTNTGARYTPASDTWTATSTGAGVPTARQYHSAVWTGTVMLVWGGANGGGPINHGSGYDPASNLWTVIPGTNAPDARYAHTAVWNGSEMIVWGGFSFSSTLATGGRYKPTTASWLPTSTVAAPTERYGHTSVWTGSEMIIFGGVQTPRDGGRYVPATDSWTSTALAPATHEFHSAVWTGSEMIVFGSFPNGFAYRYNPTSNTWTLATLTNAPVARSYHSAVWTGSVMIVWGGDNGAALNSGGRYNPTTNTWATTTLTGAPTARLAHSAVWTGSSMVIWGGGTFGSFGVNTGARYNPVSNTWSATSTGAEVPSPRFFAATVWAVSEMIVWGGGGVDVGSSGGRYDPVANTWSATSTGANVPTDRQSASAAWTGSEMIVWGGQTSGAVLLDSGGRYTPASDTWVPMSQGANLPSPRYAHTSEWTGSEVIIWGGVPATNTGGLYCTLCTAQEYYLDADGDGQGTASSTVTACALPAGYAANSNDCNDSDELIYLGAMEFCDGVDRNCNGTPETQIPPEIFFTSIFKLGAGIEYNYGPFGPTIFYDFYRGDIGALPVGSNITPELCSANDTPFTSLREPNDPALGQGWWFLVRGVNSCGNGTLGFQTNHGTPATERISLVCP